MESLWLEAEQLQAGVEWRWVGVKAVYAAMQAIQQMAVEWTRGLGSWHLWATEEKRSSRSRTKAPCYMEYMQRELFKKTATPWAATTKFLRT